MQNRKTYIILGVAAILLLLFFAFFYNKEKKYNWTEDYKEDKKPYGTHVIFELLKDQCPDSLFHVIDQPLNEYFPGTDSVDYPYNANYILIGEGMYWDSLEIQSILDFAAMGNNVFISSKDIPFLLKTSVFYEVCSDFYWYNYPVHYDSIANMSVKNIVHPDTFQFKYKSHNEIREYRWHYIESDYFCDSLFSPVVLGTMNDSLINFFRKSYGDGQFYFHTSPISFSNIQLLDSSLVSYTSQVLSHLSDGAIYWDKSSRLPLGIARSLDRNNRDGSIDRQLNSEGPLSYILSQQALRWAWYTLLAMVVLFLLFRSKRKQRMIPVLPKNKNTSLEFINTIGQLYFRKGNHKQLCLQKMNLFLAFIRENYLLNTKDLDDNFMKQLSIKSDIPKEIIDQIFLFYKNIKNADFASEKTLVSFHTELEKFYQNCK